MRKYFGLHLLIYEDNHPEIYERLSRCGTGKRRAELLRQLATQSLIRREEQVTAGAQPMNLSLPSSNAGNSFSSPVVRAPFNGESVPDDIPALGMTVTG